MKINNNVQKLNSAAFGSLSNLSEKTVKRIQDIDKISSVGQRVLIGATAMVLQPMIDMSNKNVDQKTREQSATRSIARAIIGSATGIAVRASTIKIAEKLTKKGGPLDFTTTEKDMIKMSKQKGKRVIRSLSEASEKQIKNYSATMGTLLALGVMLFTNFLVDMPLINVAQNKLMNVYNKVRGDKLDKEKKEADNVPSK